VTAHIPNAPGSNARVLNALGSNARVLNAMTVDVEDYFHVQAFAGIIPRESWDSLPCRVEANTDRILALLDRASVKATMFTLGWVAERYPQVIRRIVAAGHELASHGHGHARVDTQTPEVFRADIRKAKALLEDIGGVPVIGYRAPTFSIGPKNAWAFDVLEQEGHRYSSSVYPVKHDLYGTPDAPRFPHRPAGGALWELPMTTVQVGGRNIPCSGGGYFRLAPYRIFKRGLARFNRTEAASGMFYIHPWEIDPEQPRVAAPLLSRFRHYVNISRSAGRLDRLMRDFAWDRVDKVYAGVISPTAST
jgi:polysaccharide deacetylase family protein (PEP-CTERM system associated)